MNSLIRSLFLFLTMVICSDLRAGDQFVYLAAGGELTVFSIDAETGELNSIQANTLPGAGPFTFSTDGSRLYAVAGEKGQPQIATFERKENGKLVLLGKADINFRAGYLDVDQTGGFLAGNHYREGKVTLWKLDNGVYRGETCKELELEPRAHGANFSQNNRWLLVPATRPNKVFVNAFDPKTKNITPHEPPFATAPAGDDQARHPRHLIFHPEKNGIAYTTNESNNPGVCVWSWNQDKGALKPIQNLVTHSKAADGKVSTSTLHLTPDNKFLYVANRNKKGASAIVSLRVDQETGKLDLLKRFPCESVPRSFCIDQKGQFMYVAGQADRRLGVYKIDQQSGDLMRVEQLEVGANPVWVEAK